MRRLLATCLLAPLLILTEAPAAERHVAVDGTDVPVQVYAAQGERLLLWIPSEHGVLGAHHDLARALQRAGIESWIADPFAAYFLPVAASSLDEIPEAMVAALIDAAHTATGKQVYLATNDKGTALTLHGARRWQLAHPSGGALRGVVLLSPYLLEGTPEVGAEARYLPIAAATNLPVFVIQPVKSPLYWRLPVLKEQLARGGSPVFTQTLPEARDRFYFRPDAVPDEHALAERLPALLRNALALLASQPSARGAAALAETTRAPTPTKSERMLEVFKGDPTPPPLSLQGLDGKTHALADYRGQVVLVNFWASWCPPCVHEMPSMQQLTERLRGKPFTILAVNLAEQEQDARKFARDLGLGFPILLDPDGAAIQTWKVFAYPTSYVLDKQGRIRYALFGAIDWLEPETVGRIEALLAE